MGENVLKYPKYLNILPPKKCGNHEGPIDVLEVGC